MDEIEDLKPFKRPDQLGPMDRDQFFFAFQIANSAGALSMPVNNPEQFGINLVDEEEESVKEIRFTDIPINRALLAVKKHFGDDTDSFQNFAMRFFAMFPVLGSDQVKKWEKTDPDDHRMALLHPAVIYAGAEANLDEEGNFNQRTFFEIVDRIAPQVENDEERP